MRYLLPLVLAFLAGCGKLALHHPAPASALSARAELQSQYTLRLAAYEDTAKDHTGWPSLSDCDGAVWAGTACLGGAAVDIARAAWVPGEVHRLPKESGECYPNGAASTVSRDDLVLYVGCAWHLKATGLLTDLQGYGRSHNWYMGIPTDPNLTFMGPNLQGILARAAEKLGAPSSLDDQLPVVEVPGVKDYQQHIEVEEILLSTDVAGGATGWELGLLQTLVDGSPKDALFQAALGVYSGNFTKATDLLLEEPETPSYVRGADLYPATWWLRTARLVLDHTKD